MIVRFVIISSIVTLFFSVSSVATGAVIDSYAQQMRNRYMEGKPIKILIVPGHDDIFSGAVYNGQKEADLNLVLAEKLVAELQKDPELQVTLARTPEGYVDSLNDLFTKTREIKKFITEHAEDTKKKIEKGKIQVTEQVTHNTATTTVVYQLYGTNMWAAQEKFDLIIHIHFNDYASRKRTKAGEYTGYSVYTPETGLPNEVSSRPLANAMGLQLSSVLYQSDMTGEANKAEEYGVIPDFDLIALGAKQTLKIPSILIEYSYMYEPLVSEQGLFPVSSTILARATARGILQYVDRAPVQSAVAYEWKKDLATVSAKAKKLVPDPDVLALQFALRDQGLYPQVPMTQVDCPMTGVFRKCTEQAVIAFQKAHSIKPTGYVGPSTRGLLNQLFGQ